MKKPYLISLASYSHGVDRYLNSLEKLEDSVELIIVDFKPCFPRRPLPISKVTHVPVNCAFPGVVGRFRYFPVNLLEDDRWVIFTDTADVIFQAPIPDLDTSEANILVSCEGERFDQNWVWIPLIRAAAPALDALLPRLIYCMGTWAMRGYWAKQMVSFVNARAAEIPGPNDQPFLNLFLMGKRIQDRSDLFATLYRNCYDGRVSKDSNGDFWQDWVKPAIVHGNGGSKEFLPPST